MPNNFRLISTCHPPTHQSINSKSGPESAVCDLSCTECRVSSSSSSFSACEWDCLRHCLPSPGNNVPLCYRCPCPSSSALLNYPQLLLLLLSMEYHHSGKGLPYSAKSLRETPTISKVKEEELLFASASTVRSVGFRKSDLKGSEFTFPIIFITGSSGGGEQKLEWCCCWLVIVSCTSCNHRCLGVKGV